MLSETHYFHDGWSVVEEIDGVTGAVVAEYLNGRGLEEPLAAVLAGVNGGEPVSFADNRFPAMLAGLTCRSPTARNPGNPVSHGEL